ncbi:MAG: EF-Tu/IF-2/RF-3 family GTPase, partial [Patescibacteria group bacterium]
LLLVDAKEGPMPQTKFVLRKALQAGHKVIVVINKIDKNGARSDWTLNAVFDLFVELGASDEQTNFPIIYAAGALGKAGTDPDLSKMTDVQPLFEEILKYIPEPKIDNTRPLQMLTVNLTYDNYKGKIAIGRLYSGVLKKGAWVAHIARDGKIKKTQLTSVMLFEGLNRIDVDSAEAGDIVAIAGIPDISIGETISDPENPQALPPITIEEPTVKMTFAVNTSPFTGKEGDYSTSRNLKERLEKEVETDVALRIQQMNPDQWTVSGRGELHLAILIEKMRREGYELQVSRPQVILKEVVGKKQEPVELASVEVPEEFTGTVIEMMGKRLGVMKDMRVDNKTARMDFEIPTRGLIGFRNEFLTATKGEGIINSLFLGYQDFKGELPGRNRGSLVAHETGESNSYGLLNAQSRGQLFIGPGVSVYAGMVVGENAKEGDVIVNICKTKELTNFRTKNFGVQEGLEVPRTLSLEEALEFIADDELVEVTPKSIRLRKAFLKPSDRKK